MFLIPIVGTKFESVPPQIKVLEDQHFLKLHKYQKAICQGRNGFRLSDNSSGCCNDIIINGKVNDIECPHCGNVYTKDELSEITTLFELSNIDYKALETSILAKIIASGVSVNSTNSRYGNYILSFEESRHIALIDSPYCDFSYLLPLVESHDLKVVFIAIQEMYSCPLPNNAYIISGLEILNNGFEKSKYTMRDLPSTNVLIDTLNKSILLENLILEVGKRSTWQVVENDLSNLFLNKIRESFLKLYKYELILKEFPKFKYLFVNAAGAGKPDKYSIDILVYLKEIFETQNTFDAKCYSSTNVNSSTIETVVHHLNKDPFDSQRVVILATTNNVTCWEDVTNFKRVTGHYKLIILNARLTAEIVCFLNFEDDFINALNKCIS